GEGDNTITLTHGTQFVSTGSGDDSVYMDTGVSGTVWSGAGDDTIYVDDNGNNMEIHAQQGNDSIYFDYGSPTIFAGTCNNTIHTDAADNWLTMGSGNDSVDLDSPNTSTVFAGDGTNTIVSETGTQWISSGSGDDSISLDSGSATIFAGDGNNSIFTSEG